MRLVSYIGWVCWSVNLSRLVGLYALIRYSGWCVGWLVNPDREACISVS